MAGIVALLILASVGLTSTETIQEFSKVLAQSMINLQPVRNSPFFIQPNFEETGKFAGVNQILKCSDASGRVFQTGQPLKTLEPIGFDNSIVSCCFLGM